MGSDYSRPYHPSCSRCNINPLVYIYRDYSRTLWNYKLSKDSLEHWREFISSNHSRYVACEKCYLDIPDNLKNLFVYNETYTRYSK
jgi:hypothetical protein